MSIQKNVLCITLLMFLIQIPFTLLAEPLQLFVSVDGNDEWSGRLAKPAADNQDGPLASLIGAQKAIRKIKNNKQFPPDGIVVNVSEGIYYIDKRMSLKEADSGLSGGPVIFKGKNGKSRLLGGKVINGFKPVSDQTILRRLSKTARDNVYFMDLGKAGIHDYGEIVPTGHMTEKSLNHMELFFNGKAMQLARWPNEEWTFIDSLPPADYKIDPNGIRRGKEVDYIFYSGNRPSHWKLTDEMWMHGYWHQDWADAYLKIESIDTVQNKVTIMPPHSHWGYRKGQRFYFLNILEELDQPGEYYLDRETGMLYFWPPSSLDTGEATVSIFSENFVEMKNVSNVHFTGLSFECGRASAVMMQNGSNNVIAGCKIGDLGSYGVIINGGTHHTVKSCDIFYTGKGGIMASGGDRHTLIPAEHVLENNHIHHFSRWVYTYEEGIQIGGVGINVRHNHIHDAPHAGLIMGGNDHLLEYNEFHDLMKLSGDAGAIYMGRNWTYRGNEIRYNYFHDLIGENWGVGNMGVYLDDLASGMHVYGNIFHRCYRSVQIGGGRDNIVENNIFYDNHFSLRIDARGTSRHRKLQIGRRSGESWDMFHKLNEVPFDRPPYSLKYPLLALILFDEPLEPKGNIIRNNISVKSEFVKARPERIKDDPEWFSFGENFVDKDPLFMDAEKDDFRLRKESPAWEMGFEEIPWEKIGLQLDEFRTTK